MLCLHLPETLLEVLLYAIARKLLLVPKTAGVADLLLGVLAIAGIFFIKKYLMPKKGETLNEDEEKAIKAYLRSRISNYDKKNNKNNKEVISEENN